LEASAIDANNVSFLKSTNGLFHKNCFELTMERIIIAGDYDHRTIVCQRHLPKARAYHELITANGKYAVRAKSPKVQKIRMKIERQVLSSSPPSLSLSLAPYRPAGPPPTPAASREFFSFRASKPRGLT
jgi:hypothetical protein